MSRPWLILVMMLAMSGIAAGQDPSPGADEQIGPLPYLGESSVQMGAKFTQQAKLGFVRGDMSLDTNPYVNPRIFLDYYNARFHRLDLGVPFHLEELWVGGGVRINLIPRWLSLSPMVGTQWYVGSDDHLNPRLFADAKRNGDSQGVLFRGVATLTHPENLFRLDVIADFNPNVHNEKTRQVYRGRLAVPIFKHDQFVLEVGAYASYFLDQDLNYQQWDVIALIGPRFLLTDSAVIGLDLGVGYTNERNNLIKAGRHQEAVAGFINLFAIDF